MYHFWRNFVFTVTVSVFQLSPARGSVEESTALSNLGSPDHNGSLENVTQVSTKCVPVEYELKDVTPLGNDDLLLKSRNITLSASEYKLKNGRIFACLPLHLRMETLSALNCSDKFVYERHEYRVLSNGNSVEESTALSNLGSPDHNGSLENVTQVSTKCVLVEYELKDVTPLGNNDLLLKSRNITLSASEYKLKNGRIFACLPLHLRMETLSALNCSDKFVYERHECRVLSNGSAIVGIKVVPAGEYELSGDYLLTCVPEEDEPSTGEMTLQEVSILVGEIGSVISIIFLVAHLCAFIFVPSLRNPPGYNLASLSVAFLLAYSWILIGQIPQVLGLACVVSAVLEQNFFLTAFFCTNVLAFDVFRTLKLATEKLIVGSRTSRKKQFLWYSMYAWGAPAVITSISVIMDNSSDVPDVIKPGYGRHDICGIDNKWAKVVFFVAPAFTLILVNAIFFVMSSYMISSNTMKVTQDETKQNVRLNYILYLRLAIMMGVTWLVGIIAIIARNDVVWLVFDLLNSLQGLFLFLLFTCTKKVFKQLSMSSNIFQLHSAKLSTLSSNSTTVSMMDSNGVKVSQSNSLA